MALIGRNELCPCGSGLKLKKCCLLKSPDEIENLTSAARLKKRVETVSPYQGLGHKYVTKPKGVRKMSEIILEFAEPLLKRTDELGQDKKIIPLAIAAWNFALTDGLKDFDYQSELKKNFANLGEYDFNILNNLFEFLVQRKLEKFPDIKRLVIDYDLANNSRGFHLNVVSVPLDINNNALRFGNDSDQENQLSST